MTMKFTIILLVLSCSISRITCTFECYKSHAGCQDGQSCTFTSTSGCTAECGSGAAESATATKKLKQDLGIPDLPCDTILNLEDFASLDGRLCTTNHACPTGYICQYTTTETKCVPIEKHVAGAIETPANVPTCYLDPSDSPPTAPIHPWLLCPKFLLSTGDTLMTVKNTYDPTSTAPAKTSTTKTVPTQDSSTNNVPVLDVTKDGQQAYYVTKDGIRVPDGKGGFVTAYTEITKSTDSEIKKSSTGSNNVPTIPVLDVTKDGKKAYYVTKDGVRISDGKGGFVTAYAKMTTGTGSEATTNLFLDVTKDGKEAYYVTKDGVKIPDGKGGFVTAYTEMTKGSEGSESTKPNCGSLLKMNVLGIILMSFL